MYEAKYFTPDEFKCKGKTCGCNLKPAPVMNEKLLMVLDKIRERVQRPVIVTSAFRCEKHNKAVGGVPNSYHTQGIAADIQVTGVSIEELAQIAEECGADGIGKYYGQKFVHVDVRGSRARWVE